MIDHQPIHELLARINGQLADAEVSYRCSEQERRMRYPDEPRAELNERYARYRASIDPMLRERESLIKALAEIKMIEAPPPFITSRLRVG